MTTLFCCQRVKLAMGFHLGTHPEGEPWGPRLGSSQGSRVLLGPYHGSRAITRSPSPRTWRPDFPGARSFSGGGGKPSFPSPSAGDLRELPRVPLRGEGSCGGRSGLPFGPRSQASLQKAQGPGVCKLPKPPASRALCQAKRAPRAAPWMVEPGRLQSIGSLRVGHD